MSTSVTCSESSLAAGEPLAGTATEATSWLLVEVRGAWGRDAVADSGLSPAVREALDAFPGKVILVRRPDRRQGVTVIRAEAAESGGRAIRQELASIEHAARSRSRSGRARRRPGRSRLRARSPRCVLRPARARRSSRRSRRTSRRTGSGRRPTSAVTASRPTCSCFRTGSSWGGFPLDRVPEVVDLLRRTAGSRSISTADERSTHQRAGRRDRGSRRDGLRRLGDLRLVSYEGRPRRLSRPRRRHYRQSRGASRSGGRRELRRRARADDRLGRIASLGCMSDENRVILITGASSGIGAATARLLASRRLAARTRSSLDRQARRTRRGARRPRPRGRGRVRRDRVGRPAGGRHGRPRALRSARCRLGQRRLRRPTQLSRGHGRALARDGARERLWRGADDPGDDAGPHGVEGPPAPDRLGGRAPRDSSVRSTRRRSMRCTRWASRCGKSSTAQASGSP